MNNVTIIGRVGTQPALRRTNGGTSVCDLRVAVENSRKEDNTTWVTVTTWGKTAENVVEYVGKGREIAVTGELISDEWEDNDGAKHAIVKVNARRVDFLRTPRQADEAAESAEPEMVEA